MSEALAAESRRLEKLWDAYRAQEQELAAALAKAERLSADLAAREAAVAAAEGAARARDADVARLEEEKAALEARVRDLESLREDLKALDAYKARVADLESAYATERERLAKLFLVYEELEAEVRTLREKTGGA